MTVEAWTQTPTYTIAGTGPYAIAHPYVEGTIVAAVIVGDERLSLTSGEFSVSPVASETLGNLFLSPAAAATHAGRTIVIDRLTPDEQGWLAILGEREAALMAQLDRMIYSVQEVRTALKGGLRIRGNLDPFDWLDGTVPLRSGNTVISGPTASEIANAQDRATEAAASAAAAADSAAEALAKENSMLRDRGPWVTAVFYSPSDTFDNGGNVYITQIAHFATSIAADISAGRIRLWVQKGATGAGTGNVLSSANLSELTNKPLAYTTIGGRAVGKVDLLTFSLIDPAAVISDVETLAANESSANTLPVAKAVADYVKGKALPTAPIASWDWSTNVTTIPLIDLSGWDSVRLVGDLTCVAGGLGLQFSADNGGTYRTTGYDCRVGNPGGAANVSTSIGLDPATGTVFRFNNLVIDHMASAARRTSGSGLTHRAAPSTVLNDTFGAYLTAEVHNALRILGTTFTGGWVRAYGLRRA